MPIFETHNEIRLRKRSKIFIFLLFQGFDCTSLEKHHMTKNSSTIPLLIVPIFEVSNETRLCQKSSKMKESPSFYFFFKFLTASLHKIPSSLVLAKFYKCHLVPHVMAIRMVYMTIKCLPVLLAHTIVWVLYHKIKVFT